MLLNFWFRPLLFLCRNQKEFRFTYRLPDGVHGDRVMMQWRYVTANSCLPRGYKGTRVSNTLRALGWIPSPNMADCPWPLNDTGDGVPEQVCICAIYLNQRVAIID